MLVALSNVAAAAGHEERSFARELGGDRFAAGGSIEIEQPVSGDAIAAGRAVVLSSKVAGDAVLAGRNVLVDGDTGQNLYAAGSELVVNAAIGRNARIAGRRVDISRGARVAGNVSAAGGQINVLGDIEGYLEAAGGRIYIDGKVGGDVEARGREVVLGPNARVAGAVHYRSPNRIVQHPQAVVSGGIERTMTHRAAAPARAWYRVGHWIWTIGLMVLAAVLIAAFPGFCARVSERAGRRFLVNLLLAFVVIVCTPVAGIALLVTGIGAPLGIVVLLIYPALLLVGYASAGVALGDAVLHRVRPLNAALKGWRIVFAALAVLVLSLLVRAPWIGGAVAAITLLAGVGALTFHGWAAACGRKPAATV
ncbi:polymer-forming cytoskeletal protein [Trinickia caryophylli]|nr:polymer-forming cytoskeletal protein [Trinickia caryophylli]TRX15426.1 polymer-forming cytoskeletal protein [Trinickia caryophylli]